jgi:FK506-binding protein 2
MQLPLLSFSLLAAAAVGVLATDQLKIDVTLPVECDRKTQKGDKIQVHYKGTLLADGSEFDASTSAPFTCSPPSRRAHPLSLGAKD